MKRMHRWMSEVVDAVFRILGGGGIARW